jgi:hypothetical protein
MPMRSRLGPGLDCGAYRIGPIPSPWHLPTRQNCHIRALSESD